jgi:site-specific recombinase XerD
MTPWNKGKKLPAEPLTVEEVRALLDCCSRRAPTGIRNGALIATLYRAGLRIAEALGLKPSDFNASDGTLRILDGKGHKSRLVGLDPQACALLLRWVDKRGTIDLNGHHRLFCTLGGKQMSTAYVRNLFKRLGRKAGIEKRVHPHGLRHSHAFELAAENCPLHIIQAQLGHSSLATTDRYVKHLNPKAVVDAMQGRTWADERSAGENE